MPVVDNLRWIIGADSSEFREELTRAQRSVRGNVNAMNRRFQAMGNQLRGVRNLVIGLTGAAGFGALVNEVSKTAAEMGRMSEATGVSVEQLSTLRFAAQQTNIEFEEVRDSLLELSTRMSEARRGTGEAVEAFDLLNISVEDSNGNLREADEVMLEIADRFADMEDGSQKTALAMQLLSEQGGRELIPLLNQGSEGIREMQQRARELGLEMSAETAVDAQILRNQIKELNSEFRGLAEGVLQDSLPALQEWVTTVRFARQESGNLTAAWVALGGAADAALSETLPQQINETRAEIQRLEGELEGYQERLEEVRGTPFEDQFRRASGEMETQQERLEELRAELQRLEDQRQENQEREEERLQKRQEQRQEEAQSRQERTAELRRQQEERRRAEQAEEEAQARRESGEEAIAGMRREIELHGEVSNAERARFEISQGEYQDLSDAQQQRILALAREQDALDEAREAERQAREEKQAHEQEMEQLATRVYEQTRTETELLGQEIEQLNTLYMQGRISMETYKRAMSDVQEELGNLGEDAEETSASMEEVGKQAARNVQDAFADFLFDPFDADLEDMLQSFNQTLRRMLAEALAAQAIKQTVSLIGGMFSEGGEVEAAEGGYIRGPGTTTSDSIPARLSNREFVQPADSTSYYGSDFMEALRTRAVPQEAARSLIESAGRMQAHTPRTPRFQNGGMAMAGGGGEGQGASPIRIVNAIDNESVADAMNTPAGERTVLNIIRRNPEAVRGA